MVQDNSRRSMGRKVAVGGWVFTVALSTIFLVLGGMKSDTLGGIWLGVSACFWLTMGATFLINHINDQRSHEVLGELEALKRSVQELQKVVEARRD
jgi:hypothetical protein